MVQRLRRHPMVSAFIPPGAVAVQCTYFEKSVSRNWLVPWHQDLSIPVAARVAESSLHGWSNKEGMLFVQAPPAVLEQMVALRLHLDDCSPQDGPLRVIPGSHVYGVIAPEDERAIRNASSEVICAAERGAALIMRPLLLHGSSKASGASRRRILHFLFGPPRLPFGLRWQHAV
jgi:ectoine hydroxylase-related dioxygenase (phytanoyl-CoA dioxygenase family)